MLKYLVAIDEEEELTAADDFLGQYPVEVARQQATIIFVHQKMNASVGFVTWHKIDKSSNVLFSVILHAEEGISS